MKTTLKIYLRIWIGITTALSFLLGWIVFAHSGKPAPLIAPQPYESQGVQIQVENLPPVPSIDDLTSSRNSNSLQPLPSLPETFSPNLLPRFRSRGS
jgi:hypothetical protein